MLYTLKNAAGYVIAKNATLVYNCGQFSVYSHKNYHNSIVTYSYNMNRVTAEAERFLDVGDYFILESRSPTDSSFCDTLFQVVSYNSSNQIVYRAFGNNCSMNSSAWTTLILDDKTCQTVLNGVTRKYDSVLNWYKVPEHIAKFVK